MNIWLYLGCGFGTIVATKRQNRFVCTTFYFFIDCDLLIMAKYDNDLSIEIINYFQRITLTTFIFIVIIFVDRHANVA